MTRFDGYAAVWDVVDRAGDVMLAGAFAAVAPVPLLWRHRGAAVGRITDIGEDARGLHVAGVVEDADLAAAVRGGAVAGLSVGYRALEVRQGARRRIARAGLVEVSLVAVPMQRWARVMRVF